MPQDRALPSNATKSTGQSAQQPTTLDKAKVVEPPNASRKTSAHDKPCSKLLANGKPLSKSLSKSHDNLASTLRKKAAAASRAGNKESLSAKERAYSPGPKFKVPKTPSTPVRNKANGAHGMDNGGDTPIKRAQSAQNIARESTSSPSSKQIAVKRASSTQNVSNKGNGRQVRSSAPASAMAYNAELLASFEKEKKAQERRISELIQVAESRKSDTELLKFEVRNLKESKKHCKEELEMFIHENHLLKDKLHELGVAVEHSTDSEKLSVLQHKLSNIHDGESVTSSRSHKGGDRAISLDYLLGTVDSEPALSIGEISCVTPEHPSSISLDNSNWDKQSHKSTDSLSEQSVACLQDRLLQMEETHYSTNEELQATLQELGDLQDIVNELTSEHERLADEKSVLLESLCAQTEKLENSRMQVEHLKTLLVSESEGGDRSENERQLVALLKSGEEEKDELILKHRELMKAVYTTDNENRELLDIVSALTDKIRILEMKNESLVADKFALESQNSELKEQTATDVIETQRYKSLLENEKQKVHELEQERNATDKSELESLLYSTRLEKDKIEDKLTNVQEELAVSLNEVARTKEKLCSLEEELKVCKNNAKMQVSDLDYKLIQKETEKVELQHEMDSLRNHIDQMQIDCDRSLAEKEKQSKVVVQLENDLRILQMNINELESETREVKDKYSEETEEWKQFQSDLQTAVVIANNFKVEAQDDMERLTTENQYLKEREVSLLEGTKKLQDELDMLKQQQQEKETSRNDLRGRVMSTVDRELAVLRQGKKSVDPASGQNISVKLLINSIEEQVKTEVPGNTPPASPIQASPTAFGHNDSRRNSMDSTISLSSVKSDTPPCKSPISRTLTMPCDQSHKAGIFRRASESSLKDSRSPLGHRHNITNIILEKSPVPEETKKAVSPVPKAQPDSTDGKKPAARLITPKSVLRKSSISETEPKVDKHLYASTVQGLKTDPLANLSKQMGGSKRNALLKWCQNRTASYTGIDITNFSSSWNDGLAFCALMHFYLPDKIPYKELHSQDKLNNFTLAFKAAGSVGIPSNLNENEMVALERPDWQAVMSYVTNIYKHFEVDAKM